jgi:hypothetical protein
MHLSFRNRSSQSRDDQKLPILLAAGHFLLLGSLLVRFIAADTYAQSPGRVASIALLASMAIGLYLVVVVGRNGEMNIRAIQWTSALICYVGFVCAFTARDQSALELLVSRYGIASWYICGLSSAAMSEIIKQNRNIISTAIGRAVVTLPLIVVGYLAVVFALAYYRAPVETTNYQHVAYSFITLVMLTLSYIEAVWSARKPLLVVGAFWTIGTLMTISISLMQSSLALIFWLLMALAYIIKASRGSLRVLVTLCLLLALSAMLLKEARFDWLSEALLQTRFAPMVGGDYELSSVSSRMVILSTFSEQFRVSPFLGHFEAEIMSGVGEGNYVHSIPLSILTHTGMVGFTMFLASLYSVLWTKVRKGDWVSGEGSVVLYAVFTMALGAAATFLTWTSYWYILGLLSSRRTPRQQYRWNQVAVAPLGSSPRLRGDLP